MSANDRPVLRKITLGVGLLTIVVGTLFLLVPAIVKIGNEWILAVLLLAGGIMSAGFAVTAIRQDVRAYTTLLALSSVVTGVIALVHPLDTFITLTTLLGVFFILESGLFTGLGLTLRPHWSVCGVLFIVAAVSFVMSALIWLRLAGASKAVIVALLGVSFIARGVAYMIIAMMMKGQAPLPPRGIDSQGGTEPVRT